MTDYPHDEMPQVPSWTSALRTPARVDRAPRLNLFSADMAPAADYVRPRTRADLAALDLSAEGAFGGAPDSAERTGTARMLGLLLAGLAVFVAGFVAGRASAHEVAPGVTYPASCCNHRDCRRIPETAVEWREGRWVYLPGGQSIPDEAIGLTPREWGGGWHICTSGGTETGPLMTHQHGRPCFWRPETEG